MGEQPRPLRLEGCVGKCARRSSQAGAEMADEGLAGVPDALIDSDGVFKYVLIHVKPAGAGPGKDIVRGHAWAEYHGRCARRAGPPLAAGGTVAAIGRGSGEGGLWGGAPFPSNRPASRRPRAPPPRRPLLLALPSRPLRASERGAGAAGLPVPVPGGRPDLPPERGQEDPRLRLLRGKDPAERLAARQLSPELGAPPRPSSLSLSPSREVGDL